MRFIKLTKINLFMLSSTGSGRAVYIDPRFIAMLYSTEPLEGTPYTKIFLGNMQDPIPVAESIPEILELIKESESGSKEV